jgi:hypothetical protein
MVRNDNYKYIEEKLAILAHRINTNGKLNDMSLHLRSENFYMHFLNNLYGWKLENFNDTEHNAAAIDLICHENKIVIQVSSTNTKDKVEKSLAKDKIKDYLNYNFKFLSISKDAGELRSKTFVNKYGILFNPKVDIIDNLSLLNEIDGLEVVPQNLIYKFIKDELGREIDPVQKDTAIAYVINVISKVPISTFDSSANTIDFKIDQKIDYNDLVSGRDIIEDFSVNSYWLEEKYSELDNEAVNRSASILQNIKGIYDIEKRKSSNADEVFFNVIGQVKALVMSSSNFDPLYDEELDMCIKTVVVDAFLRCKIFKNPSVKNAVA